MAEKTPYHDKTIAKSTELVISNFPEVSIISVLGDENKPLVLLRVDRMALIAALAKESGDTVVQARVYP